MSHLDLVLRGWTRSRRRVCHHEAAVARLCAKAGNLVVPGIPGIPFRFSVFVLLSCGTSRSP